MHATPKLETRAAQPCVAIPVQASFQEWNRTIEQIPKLFEWLGQHNVTPAGPLFYRYHVLGDMERQFELEIGIAVTEPVNGSAAVVAGEIPGGTYATVVHHGHPDGIVAAYQNLEAWAEREGIEFDIQRNGQADLWAGRLEFYLTNPDDEPDPNKWSTEIAYLTKSSGSQ